MKIHTTSERLKQLMNERNLRQVDILNAAKPYCSHYGVKLGKNDLSQYVSGKVEPGQDKLTLLGLALNVSEAWLMGYNVPMERKTSVTENGNGRTEEYIVLFNQLTDDQQALVIAQIKGILSAK